MFELVFVCTGNRARSPLAEALCRRYAAGMDVNVGSAGTLDLGRLPALPNAEREARGLEVDLARHRTRSLNGIDLRAADLVLGFEPLHVAAAIEAGARPERAFLLGELVALLDPTTDGGDVARARSAVARAHARRTLSPSLATATIADPLGKTRSVMRATAREIDDLVRQLLHALFGRGEESAQGSEK